MQRLDMQIHGRVQGVAFRWHTQRQARELGLVGWVRNRPDGSVRLVAEGPADLLDRLEAWARRGPDRARVDSVVVVRGEPTGGCAGFEITG